jgi:hypothetical protein
MPWPSWRCTLGVTASKVKRRPNLFVNHQLGLISSSREQRGLALQAKRALAAPDGPLQTLRRTLQFQGQIAGWHLRVLGLVRYLTNISAEKAEQPHDQSLSHRKPSFSGGGNESGSCHLVRHSIVERC